MRSRALLSRIKAKQAQPAEMPKAVKSSPGKIAMMEPTTKKVVKEFESIDSAVADGFNRLNVVGAIKNGKKYKGHLWTAVN